MDGIKKPEDTTPPQAPLPPAGESLENNPPSPQTQQQAPPTAQPAQPVVSAPQPAPDAAQTVSAAPAGKSKKTWIITGVLVLVVLAGLILLLV